MADATPSPDSSTRWIETSRGILRYSELAPLLAERVLRVQERIETGAYADQPLDDLLIRSLHGDFCGDLVPDWEGAGGQSPFAWARTNRRSRIACRS